MDCVRGLINTGLITKPLDSSHRPFFYIINKDLVEGLRIMFAIIN
jgi:hypothetical protein